MAAPVDNILPPTSATTAHRTNVADSEITAPTDSYGIAQKPVPERADAQQAATGPGSGSVDTSHDNAVPFKEQAHGFAKKFHGIFTGNKEEKAFGEKETKGELPQQQAQVGQVQGEGEGLQPVGSDHVVPASARYENSTPSA